MANYLSFGVTRQLFYVNEACSQTDVYSKRAILSALATEADDFKVQWQAAMFGPNRSEQAAFKHFSLTTAFSFQVRQNMLQYVQTPELNFT